MNHEEVSELLSDVVSRNATLFHKMNDETSVVQSKVEELNLELQDVKRALKGLVEDVEQALENSLDAETAAETVSRSLNNKFDAIEEMIDDFREEMSRELEESINSQHEHFSNRIQALDGEIREKINNINEQIEYDENDLNGENPSVAESVSKLRDSLTYNMTVLCRQIESIKSSIVDLDKQVDQLARNKKFSKPLNSPSLSKIKSFSGNFFYWLFLALILSPLVLPVAYVVISMSVNCWSGIKNVLGY